MLDERRQLAASGKNDPLRRQRRRQRRRVHDCSHGLTSLVATGSERSKAATGTRLEAVAGWLARQGRGSWRRLGCPSPRPRRVHIYDDPHVGGQAAQQAWNRIQSTRLHTIFESQSDELLLCMHSIAQALSSTWVDERSVRCGQLVNRVKEEDYWLLRMLKKCSAHKQLGRLFPALQGPAGLSLQHIA